MNLNTFLNPYIDNNYKNFHEKLCPTKYEILGIKIPTLRKIAKELLKDFEYKEFINNMDNSIYEHIMLEGLIIANLKISYQEKIELIKNYLPKIDNWAICDIFVSELKFIKNNKKDFLVFLKTIMNINEAFYKRFIIVSLLNYYIDDEYLDLVLEYTIKIKDDNYYVKMAIAWCLSICLIKYFDYTIKFMINNKNNIDKWTYNKALQKGIESLRISKDNKDILKKMKL